MGFIVSFFFFFFVSFRTEIQWIMAVTDQLNIFDVDWQQQMQTVRLRRDRVEEYWLVCSTISWRKNPMFLKKFPTYFNHKISTKITSYKLKKLHSQFRYIQIISKVLKHRNPTWELHSLIYSSTCLLATK